MKAQVVVTPLPIGSKMRATKEENYQQLLLANNNNLVETQWWDYYLVPLEKKYQLLYRSGKSIFQVYYLQGKNLVANKEINQTISKVIEKINKQWQEIVKVMKTFDNYRVKRLETSFKNLKNEIDELITQQKQLDEQSDEYQKISQEEEKLLSEYKESSLVKEVNHEYETYQAKIQTQLTDYFANKIDFNEFLKTIEFLVPEQVVESEQN